jgi:hypothetical protein
MKSSARKVGLSVGAQNVPPLSALKIGHPEEAGSACILLLTQLREFWSYVVVFEMTSIL